MNNYHKKLQSLLVLIFSCIMITSCATQSSVGYGRIANVHQVKNKSGSAQTEAVKTGLKSAGVGAAIGASTGAVVGTATVAAVFGPFGLFIPTVLAGGALIGAGIGGVVGAGVGGGTGAVIGSHKNLYEYAVKMDNRAGNVIVAEYIKHPLPLDSRVEVLRDGDKYYLKKIA